MGTVVGPNHTPTGFIPQAIKEGRKRFNFLGQDIRLIPSCAICVTMNPGYAGKPCPVWQPPIIQISGMRRRPSDAGRLICIAHTF